MTMAELNLSGWIDRRRKDVGPYAEYIIKKVAEYEEEMSRRRTDLTPRWRPIGEWDGEWSEWHKFICKTKDGHWSVCIPYSATHFMQLTHPGE